MDVPAAGACRNCGAAAGGRYCPECGQETAPHPPTAAEFLHEFVGHYVALEGALWKTLRLLLRPGALTLEYLAGRKRRYVLPLRLYLTASLLFFVVSRFLVSPVAITINQPQVPAGAPFTLACAPESAPCSRIQARIRDAHPGLTHAQVVNGIGTRVMRDMPYAMIFLVPLFAGLTRYAYRRRGLAYGAHMVFALHVHSFAFLAGTLLAPLRLPGTLFLPAAIYLVLAMRRVFGGRAWALVLRFLFLAIAYWLLVFVTLSVLGLASLLL